MRIAETKWLRFSLQIVLPVFVTIALFFVAVYMIALPALERNLLDLRRENVRDLTRTAWGLLVEYDGRVSAGELTLEDAQSRAAERIRALRYGPQQRDYFWINDMHPNIVMHPYRTDLEGQDVSDLADPEGRHLFVEFVRVVETHGEGYVNYLWQYLDDPNRIEPKLSYVMGFEPWDWIVGTGMYLDDVHARIDAVSYRMKWLLGIILAAFFILSVYIVWSTRKTEIARASAVGALTRSEAQYRSLVEAIHDWVWETDEAGRYTYSSPAVKNLLGFRTDEVAGRTVFDFMTAREAERTRETLSALAAEGSSIERLETECAHKDGRTVVLETSATRIVGSDGVVTGYRGIGRDITLRRQAEDELRKSQEQLSRAQRMESLGLLAGGIAHDFNNLLTVILGNTEALGTEMDEVGLPHSSIDAIRVAGIRAAQLTQRLLAFSRSQVVAPRIVDLNQVMLGIDGMLRRVIGADVELVSIPNPELGLVKVDVGQVEQVLLNLAVNARDAMPEGGKLTMETHNVWIDESTAAAHNGMEHGRHTEIVVRDNGVGMTEEVMDKIFEPLFTTKETGKGTGLGLAICAGIVKECGGHISVDSEAGRGTTFKILFPNVEGEADDFGDEQVPREIAARGRETILFVDDEPLVRDLAVRALRSWGYSVLEASFGNEALELVRQRNEIDLLITDIVLPRMSGIGLAEKMSKEVPNLKVLYISGYTPDDVAQIADLDPESTFLAKPFTPSSLVTRVRHILDS